MQRREKILAALFVAAVVGWFGWPTVDGLLFEPVRSKETDLESLQGRVGSKEDETLALLKTSKRMGGWKRQSLPGDDLVAQRLYQEWLTDLATLVGFDRLRVTPERRTGGKGDAYTAVQVSVDGEATFAELTAFLDRFKQTDLLHRIVGLTVRSPAAEGDPNFGVTLAAEGLVIQGAPRRSTLFPESTLSAPLAAKEIELTPAMPGPAAKPGDYLRIGGELLRIEGVVGATWKVARGAAGTKVESHPAGQVVELWPTLELATATASPPANVFVKPRKYRPRIDAPQDVRVVRGDAARVKVGVVDYDASAGPAAVSVSGLPAGAKFDAATGEIAWTPSADVPSGDYPVSVTAAVPAPETTLDRKLTLRLVEKNKPPVVEPPGDVAAIVGRTLTLPIKASDPDGSSLKYALESGPPGAAIGANGELKWEVPLTFAVGETTASVAVTDAGDPPQTTKREFTIKVREDLSPYVYLVASIADSSDRQAWFYDRSAARNVVLRKGEPFEVVGHTGRIDEIDRTHIEFTRDEKRWRLDLGKPLSDAKPMPLPTDAARPPVEAVRPKSSEA